jgi:hypothetical protein
MIGDYSIFEKVIWHFTDLSHDVFGVDFSIEIILGGHHVANDFIERTR